MSIFRPPVNRAMRVLDRSFFEKDLVISAASIYNPKQISNIRLECHKSKDILSLRQTLPVRPDPTDPIRKCLLLKPEIKHDDKSTWGETVTRLANEGEIGVIPYHLHLGYDHWPAHDIMEAVLPEDLHDDIPSGFNPVGHIAHFNLRDRYLPYKKLIGELIIDKNASIETVVNKLEKLGEENEFRVLEYELLAGKPDFHVEVKEWASIYRFDFSKVFWNSRLSTEHKRMVNLWQPGEAVCDIMAGVGPFAIPAAKRGCFVWANDLNPDCYIGLQDARLLNKVDQFVTCFNEDGHNFIKSATNRLLLNDHIAKIPRSVSRTKLVERQEKFSLISQPRFFSHFVMNLPASAVDFLPDFVGLYAGKEMMLEPHTDVKLPMIHCYLFAPKQGDEESDDTVSEEYVCKTVSSKLGHQLRRDTLELDIHDVRDVAPKKRQFCASFRLPAEVAFARPT